MQQKKGREVKKSLKLMASTALFGIVCVAIIFFFFFVNKGLAQKLNIDDALLPSWSQQVLGIDSALDSPQTSPSNSPALFRGPGGPHIESANIDISGTVWTAEDKSTNIGSGINISLAVNGGIKTTVATGAGGTFTFSTINVTAGQPFIIFIDDGSNHGNLVSRAIESNITGLDMYTNDIVLRHEDTGPISNANLATADNGDVEIRYAVTGSDVTFEAGYKVWVESAMTYAPGGVISGESLEVRGTGTLNSASNNITLTGTWKVSSTGTLTISGGTVTFNPASGTKNIDTGGTDSNHDFNNVTKSGAGTIKLYNGTSVSSSFGMKMAGTLTLSAGTFDANGRDLTIGAYSQSGGTFDADAANSGNNQNTITCKGSFTINASLTYNARQSNLILDATAADITFTGGSYTFNDLTFQNNSNSNARTITPTAGTYTLNGSLFGEANYTQNVTLAANTNNPSFNITGGIIYQGEGAGSESISMGTGSWTVQSGNIYLTDGTITAGSSTLTSNASGWQELGEGTEAKVMAMTSWTYSGTTYLVVGGNFKEIGQGTTARRIALWDGTSWAELGGGANGAVRALMTWSYGGTDYLAVAGGFTSLNDGATSANRIALWDGTNWTALSSGLNGSGRALTIYNTNLIVGGNFTTAGGSSANYIAQWDGSNWSTFGTGMSGPVYALTTWTYSATTYLVAGGEFVTAGGTTVNNIAKWNGSAWSAFASGMDGATYHTVYALAVYSSNLIAGGDFTQVNGDTGIRRVAQWNGTIWSVIGSGFNGTVQALLVSGGNLYAGGWFRGSGAIPMKRIAKWNSVGSTWELLGEVGANKPVLALTEWTYSGTTYIVMGGVFYKVDGQLMRKIAQWNGYSWSNIGYGIEDPVRALTTYGGNLYLGGSFSDAGGVDADGIASWNGTSYSAVGGGVNGSVYALTTWTYGGTTYLAVGGNFTKAGGTTVNRIALWDGGSWSALSTGMNNAVLALTVWNNNLIAGGTFTTAGGGAANRLASWDGSNWSQVGGGVDDNSVRSLAVFGSNLEVGGNFTAVNSGTSMSRIGEWTGAAWNALGTGAASGYVYALTVLGSDLYAGGSFSSMSGVANTNYLAKWGGAAWSDVGTGMDGGYVYSLSTFDSKLIAGGDFTMAGGTIARRAAQWNGSAWSAMGTIDDNIYVSAIYNSELYVGGLFTVCSGTLINRIAKWGTQKITTASQSFNNVAFSASSTSNRKAIISGAFTIAGNLSIAESSSGILTLDLSAYNPVLTLTGTYTQGTGTAFLGGSSAITTSSTVSINGGAFTSTSNTFTVNNTFTRAAGATFTHNSGTFLFYANAAYTITTNNCTFNNVTFDKTATTARIITFADGFSIAGNLQVSNNASSPNTLTFSGTSTPTIAVTGNVTFPSTAATGVLAWGGSSNNFSLTIKGNLLLQDSNLTYYTNTTMNSTTADQGITISAGTVSTGFWTINSTGRIVTLNNNLTTAGSGTHLTVSDGTLELSNKTIQIDGNYSQTGGTFNGASGGLTLNGSTSTFALSVGTFNSPANLSVPGTFTLTSGTFVAPTGTLSIYNTFTRQVAATFTNSSGTVKFLGDTNSYNITTNNCTFKNVTFDKTAQIARTLTLMDTNLTIDGNLNVSNNYSTTLTIQGSASVYPTITVNGDVTFPSTAAAGILTWSGTGTAIFSMIVKGNLTFSDSNVTSNANYTLNSTTIDQALAINAGTVQTGNWVIDDTGHTVTLTGNLVPAGSANFTLTSGGFNMQNNNINFGGNFTQTIGTFTHGNGTITIGGTFTMNNGTFYGGAGDISIGNYQTVAINNGSFRSTSGNFTIRGSFTRAAAATFTHNSGKITFDLIGSSVYYITTNNCTFNNVTFTKDTINFNTVGVLMDGFTLDGDLEGKAENSYNLTIRSQSSINPTITVNGHLNFPPTSATGDIIFGSTAAAEKFNVVVLKGNFTLNDSDIFFYTDVTLDNQSADQIVATSAYGAISGSWIINKNTYTARWDSSMTISGASTYNFTLTSGTVNLQSNTLSISGNYSQSSGTFNGASGGLTLSGTSSTFSQSGGVFYSPANLTVPDTFTLSSSASFTAPSGTLTVQNDFTRAATATFNHSSGTVVIDDTHNIGLQLTTNNITFNNLTITRTSGGVMTYYLYQQDSYTVAGNLSVKNEQAQTFEIRGNNTLSHPTVTVNGSLDFPSTAATGLLYYGDSTYYFYVNLKGNLTISDGNVTERTNITFNGTTADQTITITAGTYSGIWTIDNGGGSYAVKQANAITISSLIITSGVWYTNGQNLTVGSTFSNDGTFRLQGGEATLSFTRDTDSGTVQYVGDGGATPYGSLLYGNIYWNLAFNSTSGTNTWTLNAALDVNGPNGVNITKGTLATGGFNITDAGNWSVGASGAFTHGSALVTFDGAATQSITGGSSPFNNLTTTNASAAGITFMDGITVAGTLNDNIPASKMTFHAGSTYTIANIDIDGAAGVGNKVTLVSSSPTNQWFFNVSQVNPTVTYVDVTDSDANGGNTIIATNNCVNGGNNENWDFGQPIINSMTFVNPYSGTSHTAVADNTTSWNFRVVVTDSHGATDVNYVEIRFANASDQTLPYDSLKLRFTEGAGTYFTEEADTQNAATLTSVNADASVSGNQWTLDFKMKLNNNFLDKDIDYNIEVYSLDDHAMSEDRNFPSAYLVTALALTFSVDSGSVNLGAINPGSPITATTVCTVTTNAPNGYDLSIQDNTAGGNSPLRHTDLVTYIADYLGTIASPTLWSGTGLGISVYSATNKEAKWGNGSSESDPLNKYAGIPQNADIIHTKTGSPTLNDETRVGYKLDVPTSQKTGTYSGDVVYTATEKLL